MENTQDKVSEYYKNINNMKKFTRKHFIRSVKNVIGIDHVGSSLFRADQLT